MADPTPILIPRETVNDDTVTIVRWAVQHGQLVKAGDPLLEIETTKAVLTIEAPNEGNVEIFEKEGATVRVGERVGVISSEAVNNNHVHQPALEGQATQLTTGNRISQKARALIEKHQLDLKAFSHLALVKESDVLDVLNSATIGSAPGKGHDLAAPEVAKPKGFLSEATASARDRNWGLFRLGFNYFFRNYLLSLLVQFAPIGVIISLHRLRGVKIGRGCFIDPTAQVETAYPENITIGNDVRLTARSVIMTHIKAPHYLRDHQLVPLTIKPVVIEDHCFIGVNSVVMPGVIVGTASVIASGAVVVNDVPAFTMVAGNPAKVVKRFRDREPVNAESNG